MTARQQLGAIGGIVAVLAAAFVAVDRLFPRDIAPVVVGARAPDFRAEPLDTAARVRALAGHRGQVVVLNIWATWCDPCRAEMPSLETLYRAYRGRGLRVVAVSIDDAGHDDDIRAFVRQYGLTFEVLHDGSGGIEQAYQTTGVPETFVIARDGVIRKKVAGAEDWSSPGNEALIAQLLAEPGGRGTN